MILIPNTLILNLAELTKPLDFDAMFERRAPVEIEIGIGSGYFLSRYAKDHPEVNLLGLDKEMSEVRRTDDKCRRQGAENVRVLKCDAIYFLEDYPAEGSVQALHVYYSDPWPKKRHHKRRLWREDFIRAAERVLAPGGDLFLKTDVTEYFEVIDRVIRTSQCLSLVQEQRLDHEPLAGDYPSNFQTKAIEAGHPLHYQHWRKATT